mmetsp:Transcript_27306/g.81908  ORF Transcript_27306/g.81908 Transcript_27306/m.81908 type:complete len:200 (+) Transcript_27306:189-788(+)
MCRDARGAAHRAGGDCESRVAGPRRRFSSCRGRGRRRERPGFEGGGRRPCLSAAHRPARTRVHRAARATTSRLAATVHRAVRAETEDGRGMARVARSRGAEARTCARGRPAPPRGALGENRWRGRVDVGRAARGATEGVPRRVRRRKSSAGAAKDARDCRQPRRRGRSHVGEARAVRRAPRGERVPAEREPRQGAEAGW